MFSSANASTTNCFRRRHYPPRRHRRLHRRRLPRACDVKAASVNYVCLFICVSLGWLVGWMVGLFSSKLRDAVTRRRHHRTPE